MRAPLLAAVRARVSLPEGVRELTWTDAHTETCWVVERCAPSGCPAWLRIEDMRGYWIIDVGESSFEVNPMNDNRIDLLLDGFARDELVLAVRTMFGAFRARWIEGARARDLSAAAESRWERGLSRLPGYRVARSHLPTEGWGSDYSPRTRAE